MDPWSWHHLYRVLLTHGPDITYSVLLTHGPDIIRIVLLTHGPHSPCIVFY